MDTKHDTRHSLHASPFGTFGMVWQDTTAGPSVRRVLLPFEDVDVAERLKSSFPGSRRGKSSALSDLGRRIRSFLDGEDVRFELEGIALDTCSEFQRSVLIAEFGIPRGWLSTYGGIAAHLGVARGARAVGRALARNPFPIIIPCHRAIGAGGRLGGYQGGAAMKRALLEHEGIQFSPTGRIVRPRLFY